MDIFWGDLGPILGVLGVVVVIVGKSLQTKSFSFIQNSNKSWKVAKIWQFLILDSVSLLRK